jgi:hypothetical protein
MALIVYNQGQSEAEVFLHEVVTPWELSQDP